MECDLATDYLYSTIVGQLIKYYLAVTFFLPGHEHLLGKITFPQSQVYSPVAGGSKVKVEYIRSFLAYPC